MFSKKCLFTSESVMEGHPDKMADQISDIILDAILNKDKEAKCAIETLFKTGLCVIVGEISTKVWVNIPYIVRNTIKKIGYISSEQGFDGFTCGVLVGVEGQSKDISFGLIKSKNMGQNAGDQGIVFGYACDDTKELMPMPIVYAHKLVKKLSEVKKKDIIPWLKPDGKSQVSIVYKNGKPLFIHNIVISAHHISNIKMTILREAIMEEVIKKTIPNEMLSSLTKFHINMGGNFTIGGPMADSGLTGRKIIVDTYGGMSRHGGGSFSGKDPSKMDRSAAYMSRYIAKNIVAAGIALKCEVQLAYVIGLNNPVSVSINTFNTSKINEDKIEKIVKKLFELTPSGIINSLRLLRPIYQSASHYGHFGRVFNSFTWERVDMVDDLKDLLY